MRTLLRLLTVMLGASLFAFSAQAEKMYGVFMVVKGKVQIQSAGKNTDAKVGAKIYEGDSVVTVTDARAKIVMSDRNVLNVSPETTLKIAKYENSASGTKNVELDLSKGKVRTNVEQTYDGEKSKFEIKTPTAVAGVRGTQFLMGFNNGATTVVTFKGSVSLASLGANRQPAGAPVIVNKGETSSVSTGKAPEPPRALPKEEMKKVEGESTVSMQTKEANPNSSSTSREPASEGSSSKSAETPAAPTAGTPAKSMIDSKDMDTGMAKEIKDVRAPTAEVAPPKVAPTIPTVKDSNIVKDIQRGTTGKTRVIVKPVIPGN